MRSKKHTHIIYHMSYMENASLPDSTRYISNLHNREVWSIALYKQERRLKRLNTLGGLEIGIQHQIVNALELHTQKKIKQKKTLFILVINLVEKNSRTVTQSSDLKTSSTALQCLEAQLSSLSLVAVLLVLFVCHVHSGSHQYSWFSRISSIVANRYRKSTSFLKRSVSITWIS